MISLSATEACCALFASPLQQSDQPSGELVAAAISAALDDFGLTGCVARVAEEFGEHPETACERMQWAGRLTSALPAFPDAPLTPVRPTDGASALPALPTKDQLTTSVPDVAVSSANRLVSRWVTGPGLPSPICRPSTVRTGVRPPMVPVTKTSSAA